MIREAEVFGLNHKFAVNANEADLANEQEREQLMFPQSNSPKRGVTIPEPFNLSRGVVS